MIIDIKLYSKKGQVLLDTHEPLERATKAVRGSKWASGRCRVWYNRKQGLWNEFEFTNKNELKQQLATCTEPDLLALIK